jgi:hypothetical protein
MEWHNGGWRMIRKEGRIGMRKRKGESEYYRENEVGK